MSKRKRTSTDGMVYSTNPEFGKEKEETTSEEVRPEGMDLRVWLEKNHRGGKIVSVVRGFTGSEEALDELGKFLKQRCGTGGSAKDGEIIIQGDHRDRIVTMLASRGYKAKKAGS